MDIYGYIYIYIPRSSMKHRPEVLTHVATLRHATDADAENHWDFEWVQLETTGEIQLT